jgi:hypothetical protein
MKDWYSVGTAHRRRDAAAASIAQRQNELDEARLRTSLSRWRGIIAAIRTTVAAYNDGIGRERLVVTETDRPHFSATVASHGGTISSLVVTLDEMEIRVECRATASDRGGSTRWVAMTRSDDETAAYVLQDWIERL